LPDNPEAGQVEAWVELAELSQDPDFRASMRRMAEDEADEHAQRDNKNPCRDFIASVRDQAGPALETGIGPVSPQADPIVAALTDHYAHISGFPDDADLRPRLAARLETVNDPRRERYLQLLAAINGWSPPDSLTPVLDWSIQAVRARIQR
jgi:hypothetical protein